MNKDNAHLYLPLVQALAEGKVIQWQVPGAPGWLDVDNPIWQDELSYRIKPLSFPPKPEGMEWHNPDGLTAEQVGDGYRLLLESEVDGRFATPEKRDIGFTQMWHPEGERWVDDAPAGLFAGDICVTYRVPLSTSYPDGSYLKDGKLVKPWTLSRHLPGFRPLRDGEEWHRQDWAEEMLPEGWRPLLEGEKVQGGDEAAFDELDAFDWQTGGYIIGTGKCAFTRTRRPLPEPPKLIPLGPADVPPGSVFRKVNHNPWFTPLSVTLFGVNFMGDVSGTQVFRSWEKLKESHEIHRPGNLDANGKPIFEPCSKPA